MKRKFILCPPCYYRVEYDFSDDNEFYDIYRGKQVDQKKSNNQWLNVYHSYLKHGIDIEIVPPAENLPELTFIGDSIFLMKDKAIISNFKHPIRQKEAEYIKTWAYSKNFEVIETPKNLTFEGNAETIYIYSKNVILMAYGKRTSLEMKDFLEKTLGIKVIPIETYRFHLDICLFAINDIIIYAENTISEKSLELLKENKFYLIKVPEEWTIHFGLNNTYYEDVIFCNQSKISDKLSEILLNFGYKTECLDLSEFHLVGGGVKCLTLEHYK
ncbi:MAG: arginine deiminase-related protein [candidate division WOR-3 bacterium]|nr:arginine deiminase-related protein [candidate division WOR-3 bacterium]MDW8150779.1 arginine deiminase-related protein [candidate division WOR-3 bacterium]